MDDAAEVRTEEELDRSALVAYLRPRLPLASAGDLEVRSLGGGHSNLTYLLRFGGDDGEEAVLRRPPLGPILPTAHDVAREFRVLSALTKTDVPAPEPYLLCEDTAVIGAPFYVMERRRGFIVRAALPAELAEDTAARRAVSDGMVDTLATLHAVDWEAVGLGDFGRPGGYLARQIRRWSGQWEKSRTREVDVIDRLTTWLGDHVPEDAGTAVVHGDFKLDNVMFACEEPGRAVAVLDWEMATIGDPLADLGYLLSYWPEAGENLDIPTMPLVTTMPGFATRAELVALYEERTGRSLCHLGFYRALALYKLAIIAEGIFSRFAAGQTSDERFAPFGDTVPRIAGEAWRLAQESDREA